MEIIGSLILSVIALTLLGLFLWRQRDHQADRAETARLISFQPVEPPEFSYDMVADLPEPARRFFRFAIKEGTPLYTVAQLEMTGQFGMGDKTEPRYMSMRARQTLGAPEGFVWAMTAGSALSHISGSDTGRWTRFWLARLLPVARSGGTLDHQRSAFGRYIAEALFWTPGALLPAPHITWTEDTHSSAHVTLRHRDMQQTIKLKVDPLGRPVEVSFLRWSNANPEKTFRLQNFGGYLSNFQTFQGFHLPTHIEAGNHFQSDDYFPFFVADITDIRFPHLTP